MSNRKNGNGRSSQDQLMALERWDDDGEAGPVEAQQRAVMAPRSVVAYPEKAEVDQLRVRVIALEAIAIALLTEASDRQLGLAAGMTAHFSPRPGFTRHALTIHAAERVVRLVQRSVELRQKKRS